MWAGVVTKVVTSPAASSISCVCFCPHADACRSPCLVLCCALQSLLRPAFAWRGDGAAACLSVNKSRASPAYLEQG